MTGEKSLTPSNWQQLCGSVLAEMNPNRLLERIAVARSAIVSQIEDGHSTSDHEQLQLRHVLARLDNLRKITEHRTINTRLVDREVR